MPEVQVTDPRLRAQILANAQPVQSQQQPAPGSVTFPQAPDRTLGNQQTTQSISSSQTSQANSQQDQAAKNLAREQTEGVDTTEGERRAAYLAIPMERSSQRIMDTIQRNPEAIQPGWMEWATGQISPTLRDATLSDEVKEARQVINNNFEDFTRNALTLATGAAYKDEELEGRIRILQPQVTDSKAAILDKFERMRDYIEAARVASGASELQIDAALANLQRMEEFVQTGSAPWQRRNNDATELPGAVEALPPEDRQAAMEAYILAHPEQSTQTNAMTRTRPMGGQAEVEAAAPDAVEGVEQINPRYQQEYEDFVYSGEWTPQEYAAKRRELDEKFGYGQNSEDYEAEGQRILDRIRSGGKLNLQIPPTPRELSLVERVRNAYTQSDEGATLTSYANAMSFGGVEALDPQGMDALREAKPIASMVGDIAGSIAPTVAMEKLLLSGAKKLIPGAARRGTDRLVADVAANTAYGSARGAADDDMSAGEGAAYGGLASLGGRFLTRGGRGFGGTRFNDDLATLDGADMTTFQRAGMGRLEETLGGLPLVRGAREKALESFNLTDANNALRPLGERLPRGTYAGTELAAEMGNILNRRYNVIMPQVTGTIDPGFQSAIGAIRAQLPAGAEARAFWRDNIAPLERQLFDANGNYTGQTYREVQSRLRALKSNLTTMTENQGHVWAQDTARLVDKLQTQIRALVGRNTPEIGDELRRLETAWAKSVQIDDAVNRATGTKGVYTPTQKLASIKKGDTSIRQINSSRGKALGQEYAQAAQRLMGTKAVPDSISFWQTLTAALTSGAGTAAGAAGISTIIPAVQALAATAAFAGYMPMVKRLTQALIAGKRPAVVDNEAVRQMVTQYMRQRFTEE